MLKVINKETGKTVTVYGISGLSFLLWDEENECWWYENINNYKPLPDDKDRGGIFIDPEAFRQFSRNVIEQTMEDNR